MKKLITLLFWFASVILYGQVTQEDYDNLLQQYIDCCNAETYNATSNTQRPVAKTNASPCKPQMTSSLYYPFYQSITDEIVYDKTFYFIKISAVREENYLGGMPQGSWRLPGNEYLDFYIAAQGFEAVFMGPYQSHREAWSYQQEMEDRGFCNTIIIEKRIRYVQTINIVNIAGKYQ